MTYKTILLHLDNEQQAPKLARFASNVASQFGAHLIGLFVMHPLQVYVGRAGGVGISSDLTSALAKEQYTRMKNMEAIFERETKNQDFMAEWRFIDERIWPVADTLLQEATTADLLIIGHQAENYFTADITHNALLSAPTPVLVMPENYEESTFAQNVLVAWDGTPEVARAVHGARPILQSAENVWLHHIRSSVDINDVMTSNMKDLAENMARHGINVEISEATVGKKDVASNLSNVIRDRSVDSLVMGAYGHSKIRNLFLGSTTDYALKNLDVPLLMWH